MRAFLASACVAVLSLGCGPPLYLVGDGSLTAVNRDVAGATSVRLTLPASLTVQLGAPASIRVEGETNLLPYISTDVRGGVLTIGVAPGVSMTPTRAMRLVLTAPALRGLTTTSAGNITAPALTAMQFSIESTSSGSISLARLDADRLDTRLTSSGDVQVDAGKVRHHEVRITSSGDVTATGLESATAKVSITSSGTAWLWVTDTLDATLTSSGSVRYVGSPRVSVHSSSSGTVESMEIP